MQILEQHDQSGWITAIIEGRWVKAKVYNEPSTYGINNGRVSKLTISHTASRNPGQPFFEQMDYNYDRGLDFWYHESLSEELLNEIVAQLEKLPIKHVS